MAVQRNTQGGIVRIDSSDDHRGRKSRRGSAIGRRWHEDGPVPDEQTPPQPGIKQPPEPKAANVDADAANSGAAPEPSKEAAIKDQGIRLDFGDSSIDAKNHARLIYDGRSNQFTLADGQSRVLIYVDEKPLISELELKGGETIQIGDTQLLFVRLCDDDFSWDGAESN